jgi:predicted O-methyltransferase YrrM
MMLLSDYHPDLVPPIQDFVACREDIIDAYEDYIVHVSPEQMAISLETATYIYWLAVKTQPATLADYGSGFTSYVLRAVDCGKVLSVDDQESWLNWTFQFLERWNVCYGDLLPFETARHETEPGSLDLIVYDFAAGEKREAFMGWALDRLAPGGLCVFDDAQHAEHQNKMRAACKDRKIELFDLSEITKDRHGRFAALAVAPR